MIPELLSGQEIPFEQNMPYPQRAPDEGDIKYVGLQPLVRPLVTPMSNEQMRRDFLKRYLSDRYMEQRRLPSLQKTSMRKLIVPDKDEKCPYGALQHHLQKHRLDNMEKELEHGWLRAVNRLKKSDTPTV